MFDDLGQTQILSPAEILALQEEGEQMARRPRAERRAPLPPPFVPAPGEEEWWAKVAAVWDCGGR